MKLRGIDFTSAPCPRKVISCVHAELQGSSLRVEAVQHWPGFPAFEAMLTEPGPWIAAIDFPFGQSATFVRNVGWPSQWRRYVALVGTMKRKEFRARLDAYRKHRAPGDKEHRRETDIVAGAISPQKLFGVPVGLMFFEGAPRLLQSGVTIPRVHVGDPERIVVEAYPGALARHLIGRRSYKNDSARKQTPDQLRARLDIVDKLRAGALLQTHGVKVEVDSVIAEDPGADDLDALLCAVQAASAWLKRERGFGSPPNVDASEGWIAEPTIYPRQ